MRLVILLLIAVNVGVFSWLYFHHEAYRPAPITDAPQFARNVEPLQLLSERNPAQSTPTESHPQRDADRRATPQPTQDIPAIPEDRPPDSQPEATDETVVEVEPEETVAALSPHAGPEQESNVERPDPAPPVPEPDPVRLCHSIGPFPDRQRLTAFLNELTGLDQDPVVRMSRIEQPSGYWVYLPSMPRTEARAIVGELAAKGVQDYFLGRQNFISLGVFNDKRTAEDRVREIAALGYQPRLEPRFLTREVFWLDLEESGADPIAEGQWQVLLGAHDGIRRQPVACQ